MRPHVRHEAFGTIALMRIGQGIDAHAFAEGRGLMLGGVDIPHRRGLVGHSDADVLAHAIIDAILGAAGMKIRKRLTLEILE